MDKIVCERLFSMSEEKYRDFSKALIPGCDNILGVRVPLIRKYARELLRENEDWQGLLEEDDLYFEETMLRGFITGIATAKEDDQWDWPYPFPLYREQSRGWAHRGRICSHSCWPRTAFR